MPAARDVAEELVKIGYDRLSRRISLKRYADATGTDLAVQTDYGYDFADRLTSMSHGNGWSISYEMAYDVAGRLTSYVTSAMAAPATCTTPTANSSPRPRQPGG